MAKCLPPKSPYHKNDFSACADLKSFDLLFLENVNDIAESLSKILTVFGIHPCMAKTAKSVIVKAFKYYDNKRHSFQTTIEGGLSRNDVVCKFQRKCKMSYMEALLSYTVLKRAVKAFFYGTPDFSIRSPVTEAVVLKEHKFIWQHAATRTNQLFGRFEQVFSMAPHNYAKQITKIYEELYERIKNRADPVIIEDFHPRGCVKKVIIGTKSPPKDEIEKPKCVEKCKQKEDLKIFKQNLPNKAFPLTTHQSLYECLGSKEKFQIPLNKNVALKKKKKRRNLEIDLPRCYQCNCPQLFCDCKIEKETGILAIDCSQGPFKCQWVRVNDYNDSDLCSEEKHLHICPIDCASSESSSESDSHQYCDCSEEADSNNNENSVETESMQNNYEETINTCI